MNERTKKTSMIALFRPHKKYKFLVGRARASFRQSFRFGNMGLRDRGTRLAGYLTPPSDVTQEEEETASERIVIVPCDTNRFVLVHFLNCFAIQ
jgi:hypothetical protein